MKKILKIAVTIIIILLIPVLIGGGGILYLSRHGARVEAFRDLLPSGKPSALYFSSPASASLGDAFEDLKGQLCYAAGDKGDQGAEDREPGLRPCGLVIDFIQVPMESPEYLNRAAGRKLLPAAAGVYFIKADGKAREFYPAGLNYLGPEREAREYKKLKTAPGGPRENRLLEPANRLLSPASEYQHIVRNLPALMVGLPGIGLLLAFLAGLTVSFSPCALPMYPALIGFVAGESASKAKGIVLSLLFVVGLSLTLTGLGIAFALILRSGSHIIWGWFSSRWMYLLMFGVLCALGLHLVGIFTIRFPSPVKMAPRVSGYIGALLGGVLFGFVTNTCVAPITVALVLFASSSVSIAAAGAILFTYGLGQGFLLILIGAFTARMRGFISRAGRWSTYVNYFSGGVLLVVALYFLYNFMVGH